MDHLEDAGRRSAQKSSSRNYLNSQAKPARYGKVFSFGLLALVLILWEILTLTGRISVFFFPTPSSILLNLIELGREGDLWVEVWVTAKRMGLGLIFGGVPAVLLGLVMGWSKNLRSIVDPFIAAFHPIPKISIFPLIMIIFGLGEVSKVIVVSIAVFFPMMINTMAGVIQINPLFYEVAFNYGASAKKLFRRVILPSSLPMITTGLRIALNTALVVTIAVELVSSNQGLGAMIWLAWETLRIKDLYGALVVIALLGIITNSILQFVTRQLLPWYKEQNY